MRKLSLLSQLLYTNLVRCMVMFFFSALLSIGVIYALFLTWDNFRILIKTDQSGFSNMVFYYNDEMALDKDAEEQITDLIEKINGFEGVSNCYLAKGLQLRDDRTGKVLELYQNIYPYNVNLTYNISMGKMVSKNAVNQIVLSDDFKNDYKIGEIIDFSYADFNTKTLRTLSLEIVGFALSDELLQSSDGGESLDAIFQTRENMDQYSDGYGITRHLVDSEGAEIFPYNGHGFSFIITPDKDVTAEEVKINMNEGLNTSDNNRLLTGKEMIKEYKDENRTRLNTVIVACLMMLSLTISTLFSMIFMQLKKQQYEMTVLYVGGATWFTCVVLYSTIMIPSIILGSILGLFASSYILADRFAYQNSFGIATVIIVLFISLLCILPFFISLHKKSPIECIRKD